MAVRLMAMDAPHTGSQSAYALMKNVVPCFYPTPTPHRPVHNLISASPMISDWCQLSVATSCPEMYGTQGYLISMNTQVILTFPDRGVYPYILVADWCTAHESRL